MRPRTRVAALVTLMLSSGTLGACGFAGSDDTSSVDVAPTSDTTVEAGSVRVVVPAGVASGGQLQVQEGPVPDLVPDGVESLGNAAAVSVVDGSLTGPVTVSFAAPAELTADQVPVVMAKPDGADWQWLSTSWDGSDSRVTAQLSGTGEVYLARFDPSTSVDDAVEEFVAKANNPSKAHAPDCGNEQAAEDAGLETSSESGDAVKWCAGIDTIDSNPTTSQYDLDPAAQDVQAKVLRVTNNTRLFQEVGYPEGWPAVDGSGRALPGQELRKRLGLAGTTRDGLVTRVLAPAETLNLLLPGDAADLAGTVTADLSAAAWTLSALDFATSTYTRMVSGVDEDLGDRVRQAREVLVGTLASGPGAEPVVATQEPEATGGVVEPEPGDVEVPTAPTLTDEDLAQLRECLAPVADVILMNPDAAKDLLDEAMSCAPAFLRSAISDQEGGGPAEMADGIASAVVSDLPAALKVTGAPWAGISDAATDADAGFQVWVGTPG